MKSFHLTSLLVLALLVLVTFSGCTSPDTYSNTSTTDTTTMSEDTSADATADILADEGDSGISASELDQMQSDLDELDADVSGVSETA